MKKICHILSAFNRYDTRVFTKQCYALVEDGYKVFLLVNDSLPNETIDGIQIITCKQEQSSRIKRIISALRIFYTQAKQIDADIYIIHDPELIYLGIKLKKLGKKIIYDSHEDFPMQILEKEWISIYIRPLLSKIANSYLKKILPKYDLVLSVTPHIVDKLSKYNKNSYCVTNYPISELVTRSSKDEYVKKDNVLCYAGTVYRSSNQEVIIKSIEDIECLKYIIVGEISDSFKNEINLLLKKPNVEYINHTTQENVKKIYLNCTIGMAVFDYSPNLGYKTGSLGVNKFFEYMMFGLPVICTDFDLWKEIIDKYKCGIYVESGNVEQIREAILYLIKNKEKAYEMGQNGQDAVLKEFNWNTQKEFFLKLVNELST